MKAPSELRALPHLLGRRIDLSWRNPPAAAFAPAAFTGVRMVRRERTFPLTPDDGDTIFSGVVAAGSAAEVFSDLSVTPLKTYYYTVFALDSAAESWADEGSRAFAFATESYGHGERLYRLLPGVHQRLDVPLSAEEIGELEPAVAAALRALPTSLRGRGQLRRFFEAAAAPFDLLRSFAEGLRQLYDVEIARPDFLAALAQYIGWDYDRTLPVYQQRTEIRSAPALYRDAGTLPNLRTIVSRYTGWYAQALELDDLIARSNAPPQLNVFSSDEDSASGWRGSDDAAPPLGFGAGNDQAQGAGPPPPVPGGTPAVLVGSVGEPFALRPGMELTITADERLPTAVRFDRGDFVDIANASADEVVAVLRRTLTEVGAEVAAVGPTRRIRLTSHSTGSTASIVVERRAASLVTLEGAPRGRLATLADSTGPSGRLRLFYETFDAQAAATRHAMAEALSGRSSPTGTEDDVAATSWTASASASARSPANRVRYKTFRGGEWGGALGLPFEDAARGEPAVAQRQDGSLIVAWVQDPGTPLSSIRYATARTRLAQPARLAGKRSFPFAVRPGMRLYLRGNFTGARAVEFAASDMATVGRMTLAEALAVLARIPGITAAGAVDGTLRISSIASGGAEFLELDLAASNAAAALGFDAENARGTGDWGDALDFDAPAPLAAATPGSSAAPRDYRDLWAVTDGLGQVRLFWSVHEAGRYRVEVSRWDGTTWLPAVGIADTPGGDREPYALLDSMNQLWVLWSRRALSASGDVWTLHHRLLPNPAGDAWAAEPASPIIPAASAADRAPAALRLPSGDFRVYFASNRGGSRDLFAFTFRPSTGIVIVPAASSVGGAALDHAPAPVPLSGGGVRLLFRSDRSVSLSRAAVRAIAPAAMRATEPRAPVRTSDAPARSFSHRSADPGVAARMSGATTACLGDAARNGARRQWDDLASYTPQRIGARDPLRDDDLYARGTVALYLSPVLAASPLAPGLVDRLRPVLDRFLPINVRVVVILAPRVDLELVYSPSADLVDSYFDNFPFVESFGDVLDSTSADVPAWLILQSNRSSDVSASTSDLTTLRRRTFFRRPLS